MVPSEFMLEDDGPTIASTQFVGKRRYETAGLTWDLIGNNADENVSKHVREIFTTKHGAVVSGEIGGLEKMRRLYSQYAALKYSSLGVGVSENIQQIRDFTTYLYPSFDPSGLTIKSYGGAVASILQHDGYGYTDTLPDGAERFVQTHFYRTYPSALLRKVGSLSKVVGTILLRGGPDRSNEGSLEDDRLYERNAGILCRDPDSFLCRLGRPGALSKTLLVEAVLVSLAGATVGLNIAVHSGWKNTRWLAVSTTGIIACYVLMCWPNISEIIGRLKV